MYRALFPCEFIDIGMLMTFIFFNIHNLGPNPNAKILEILPQYRSFKSKQICDRM